MAPFKSIWQIALEQKIVVEEISAPLSLTDIQLRVDSTLTFLYTRIAPGIPPEDRHRFLDWLVSVLRVSREIEALSRACVAEKNREEEEERKANEEQHRSVKRDLDLVIPELERKRQELERAVERLREVVEKVKQWEKVDNEIHEAKQELANLVRDGAMVEARYRELKRAEMALEERERKVKAEEDVLELERREIGEEREVLGQREWRVGEMEGSRTRFYQTTSGRDCWLDERKLMDKAITGMEKRLEDLQSALTEAREELAVLSEQRKRDEKSRRRGSSNDSDSGRPSKRGQT